ncbi:MAG: S-methyl-5'-thioadenosine phosphorylase [Candidatus Aureabacteria bacterium]|nr:S-methyl-5'-thioadenosine phosphorylase [Candidatus Auribacterota bacterium]
MTGAPRIGIIGGSGLYQMAEIGGLREERVETPFGSPSDRYTLGTLAGREVVFLPRHGPGHRLMPTDINYRANIFGMKKLGVGWIIAVSAVGSLQERYRPLDIVIVDQFFDRTSKRHSTFFEEGLVAHIAFADPICGALARILYDAGKEIGAPLHMGGTYVNMEGPAFSTKAEAAVYRAMGLDLIGMTNLTEAKLAREAEICYATIAMVTDYDCWHPEHEAVTVETVVRNLRKNAATATQLILKAIKKVPHRQNCPCASALAAAIITQRDTIPPEIVLKLQPLVGKYLMPGQKA